MRCMDLFRRKTTSDIAKDRLKVVRVSDRSAVNPEIMERIKNDIIQVLAKYVEIDQDGLDIKITQVEAEGEDRAKGSTVPALYANIPIKSMKQSN